MIVNKEQREFIFVFIQQEAQKDVNYENFLHKKLRFKNVRSENA